MIPIKLINIYTFYVNVSIFNTDYILIKVFVRDFELWIFGILQMVFIVIENSL